MLLACRYCDCLASLEAALPGLRLPLQVLQVFGGFIHCVRKGCERLGENGVTQVHVHKLRACSSRASRSCVHGCFLCRLRAKAKFVRSCRYFAILKNDVKQLSALPSYKNPYSSCYLVAKGRGSGSGWPHRLLRCARAMCEEYLNWRGLSGVVQTVYIHRAPWSTLLVCQGGGNGFASAALWQKLGHYVPCAAQRGCCTLNAHCSSSLQAFTACRPVTRLETSRCARAT